jgi:hypothetical protein
MTGETKKPEETSGSESHCSELLSTFLDEASEAKSKLMDKEIGTFLSLEGVTVSLLENPEVSKRGSFERHPDGTEYFLWDGDKVLKFNPPSVDDSLLTFDCDRLYLK